MRNPARPRHDRPPPKDALWLQVWKGETLIGAEGATGRSEGSPEMVSRRGLIPEHADDGVEGRDTTMRRHTSGPGPNLAAPVSSGPGAVRLPALVARETPTAPAAASPPLTRAPFSATADRLWSVTEVSRFLGVPVATLRAWRCQGLGPVSVKLGRHVRYDPDNVRDWVAGLIA